MNPVEYPLTLAQPRRVTPQSTWHGHIPFAMAIVEILRPRLLVELGTHWGDSYCAFCQAAAEAGVDARCYAVDTWEGDEQTGFYGDDVLADLRAHHDPLYEAFSTLLQTRFDEANDHFSDGTIDLLHIDGCHTYEAVKHDFGSWLPRLSNRAVVLLHDTNVRRGEFGVWRLWSELEQRYPTFQFLHSLGLGVVLVGDDVPEPLRELVAASPEHAIRVRELYATLGATIELRLQIASAAGYIDGFQRERTEAAAAYEALRRHASQLEGKVVGLEEHAAAVEGRASGLATHAAAVEGRARELEGHLERVRLHGENLERKVAALEDERGELQQPTAADSRVAAAEQRVVTAFQSSRLMRYAQRFRRAVGRLRAGGS